MVASAASMVGGWPRSRRASLVMGPMEARVMLGGRMRLAVSSNAMRFRAVDALVKGARYDAAVRLRLDVAQLPKPFQINALASRDWSLQSEWYRWSFTP